MIKGYLIITIILITDLIVYLFKGISLSGQLSDKILFWLWLIMTIIVAIRFLKRKKWVKWYLGIIVVLIILSLIPGGVPFLSLTEFATRINTERRIENYRLRSASIGLIDNISIIKVVRNMGIIEIEIDEMDFNNYDENYSIYNIDEIRLLKEKDVIFFEFKIDGFTIKKKLENYRSNCIL